MPKPAFARFAFAALAAALLLAACSDRVPAQPTPAPTASSSPSETSTPGATATPTATPTPASPDPVLSAIPLEIAGEKPFPANTAFILETGCWQCDGPTTGLLRVYQRPSGDFAMETLLDPIIPASREGSENAPTITGYAIASDLSEIVVGICIRGTCATDGLYSWSAISNLAIYHSADGGISWEKAGEMEAGVGMHGILGPGRYLVARSEVRNEITYEAFPDDEPLQVPAGANWPLDVADGESLWWTHEGSRVLRLDGSTFVDFGSGTNLRRATSDGSTTVLTWGLTVSNQTRNFLSLVRGGTMRHYELQSLATGIPFEDDIILANVYPSGDSRPSLIDINGRVVNPIGAPFTRPDFPSGRNYIVAAQTGPFARVVNTGSCLNIRGTPSLDSNVITCAADRVLLRDQGETAEADGITWVRVTTPSGIEGWAAAVYLER